MVLRGCAGVRVCMYYIIVSLAYMPIECMWRWSPVSTIIFRSFLFISFCLFVCICFCSLLWLLHFILSQHTHSCDCLVIVFIVIVILCRSYSYYRFTFSHRLEYHFCLAFLIFSVMVVFCWCCFVFLDNMQCSYAVWIVLWLSSMHNVHIAHQPHLTITYILRYCA